MDSDLSGGYRYPPFEQLGPGELNDLAERCLVTDKLKKKLNVETVQLKTSIAEESYMRCKKALLEKSRECHKLTCVFL